MPIIGRHERIFRIAQDADHLIRLGCCLECGVDRFDGDWFLGDRHEIDDRDGWCRHSQGEPVELALEFRDHEVECLGGPG